MYCTFVGNDNTIASHYNLLVRIRVSPEVVAMACELAAHNAACVDILVNVGYFKVT